MSGYIRDLYDKILAFEGEELYESILEVWVKENDYKRFLSSILAPLSINESSDLSEDDSWEMYALTRVLDVLTLRFQPDNSADGDWPGPALTVSEYTSFVELIGLKVETPRVFDPFNCEILEAQKGQNDFEIIECCFPTVKLKGLVIKRGGVKILLNPLTYDLALVNKASIYWAFRRKNRKYLDLSQGWGSNSQWRTNFRVDIETATGYIYNKKGKLDLNNVTPELLEELSQQGLDIQDGIELTKFRHFIKSTKEDTDLFPYNFKYEEKKNIS